jgi:hypothetical protein
VNLPVRKRRDPLHRHDHLEGDFPGGVVGLRYQFALRGGLIERLPKSPDFMRSVPFLKPLQIRLGERDVERGHRIIKVFHCGGSDDGGGDSWLVQ